MDFGDALTMSKGSSNCSSSCQESLRTEISLGHHGSLGKKMKLGGSPPPTPARSRATWWSSSTLAASFGHGAGHPPPPPPPLLFSFSFLCCVLKNGNKGEGESARESEGEGCWCVCEGVEADEWVPRGCGVCVCVYTLYMAIPIPGNTCMEPPCEMQYLYLNLTSN
jgi:hypothetical protein